MVDAERFAARVKPVLLGEWDPIGISDEPAAHDEYDAYAPAIARLIAAGATTESLIDHLLSIERERMGLRGNRPVAEKAARLLLSLPRD
jgi:hypothetical protein